MLTIIGSSSNLKNGRIEDLEISAVFKNLDSAFCEADFERQLTHELERVREEIMAHRSIIIELNGQVLSCQKLPLG